MAQIPEVFWKDLAHGISRFYVRVRTRAISVSQSPSFRTVPTASFEIQGARRTPGEPFHVSGKKPVIYVFSPCPISASVQVSLVPQWKFSAVYPVVPISTPKSSTLAETIEWSVLTRKDGTVLERTTGLDVAYLFWEAETNDGIPMSPPTSPQVGAHSALQECFVPTEATVGEMHSVLLSLSMLPCYLDKELASLGLHTEARTSFITYWLPTFNKYGHIALRFLPQQSYEQAAPLNVTPKPDVVTRIFMLFRGVPDDQANSEKWVLAKEKAEFGIAWSTVVGVDVEKTLNPDLFRVVEWGGMEVYE